MATAQDLLSAIYGQTQPLRDATLSSLLPALQGAPASSIPGYAPQRSALEGQFNVAQNQLYSAMPRGGQLNASLADLFGKRASAVSGLENTILGNARNQAMQLGFGMIPSELSTASAIDWRDLQARAAKAAQASATAANLGTAGGFLGALLTGIFGGK